VPFVSFVEIKMDFTLVPLSKLDSASLDGLANLHQAVMHTLLSDLGFPIVRRYYQACQEDLTVIGLCAVSSGTEILGFAVGSPHPDALNARLRQPLGWFTGQMLRLALTRPRVFLQLVISVLSSSSQMETGPGAIELTYIGVAPSARGQGLGTAVLKAFAGAARAAGYRTIVLSVETDNPEAVALYTKSGFKITRTFTEGRFQRHRMELVC
jgi:ribosomal protein S18 acetylase RimI-like enzyme